MKRKHNIINKDLQYFLADLKKISDVTPDPIFQRNARIRILNKISTEKSQQTVLIGQSVSPRRFNFFHYALLSLLLFVIPSAGTVFAAQSATPADFLYPIKTASEKVALTVAPTTSLKFQIAETIANRRAQEVESLKNSGNEVLLNKVNEDLQQSIIQAEKYHPPKIEEKVDHFIEKQEQPVPNKEPEKIAPTTQSKSPVNKKNKEIIIPNVDKPVQNSDPKKEIDKKNDPDQVRKEDKKFNQSDPKQKKSR